MAAKKRTGKEFRNMSMTVMLSSVCVGVLICVAIFVSLGIYMNKSSYDAIDQTGELYMENMGGQVAKRYETAIDLRFDMIDAIIITVDGSIDGSSTMEHVRELLRTNAEARGFNYVALYDGNDGMDLDPVLGEDLEIFDKEPFKASLKKGERKAAVGEGKDKEGNVDNGIVFMSVPTDKYQMTNGGHCISLIFGMPNKDIVEMLDIDKQEGSLVYSHIIRSNGSYVIRSNKDQNENYFDRIQEVFNADGHPENAKEHIDELYNFMNNSTAERHSCILNTQDRRHLYSQKLMLSEWYLVTVMEDGSINNIIEGLSTQWLGWIIGACASMLVIMIAIFIVYMHLNKQNVKRLEDAREEALQASKAKSEFLSNMSHDIRTPMNAIVGMTAIATANINNRQQTQDCLKKIALSSKHLLGLINDILDMSKIESGKMTLNMEEVSLREVMDGIATIVQPQIKIKNQHFDVYIHDIITENVYCDSVRLNQVLLNLLSNAIKFTSNEGNIEVSLCQEPSPIGDDYVRCHIRVKDNGIGMSPEFQKKIYDSFSREDSKRVHKTEGTGLGMSITKYIVDAMRGTIELNSELGKGSEFHITLELERAQVPEAEMILPSWKMLVVDDDELLCQTAVESLKEIGITAEWTLDGESAVEKAVAAHAKRSSYDIILMDWKLPGIDGLETARRLRAKLGDDIPILLISAYDWSDIEAEARDAGISGFISKPLFKSTLFYGLKKLTDEGARDIAAKPEKPDDNMFDGMHILVAEDNDLNWEIAEALLESEGFVCDHAENGQICVDMLKDSAPGTYKAILMDIRMPVMTGYEATKAIRVLDHADKDLPIIAMTADAFSDDIKKCLECGMNAHIAKPIDIDYVKSVLAKFVK